MIQLLNHMTFQELQKGEFLFKRGDQAKGFFFLLKGKMELIVEDQVNPGEYKFSKNVDEFDFFGLKQNSADHRQDFARVVTDKCFVIHIDKA